MSGTRTEKIREKKEAEPITCYKCHAIRLSGPVCPQCGHRCSGKVRRVMQTNGKMKMMSGDIYKPRRRHPNTPDIAEAWRKMYFRGRSKGMSFAQCEALFAKENNWMFPPRGLKNMPKPEYPEDWFRSVGSVPNDHLIGREKDAGNIRQGRQPKDADQHNGASSDHQSAGHVQQPLAGFER